MNAKCNTLNIALNNSLEHALSSAYNRVNNSKRIIVCPQCKNAESSINLTIEEHSIVHIKCKNKSCNFEKKIDLSNYLSQIEDINNQHHDKINPHSKCPTHSNKLMYYCSQCDIHFCGECDINKHLYHICLYDLTKLSNEYLNLKGDLIETLEKGEEYLYEDITKLKDKIIGYYSEIITNINNSYFSFKKNQDNIINLIRNLIDNYSADYPSEYQLQNLLNLTQLKIKYMNLFSDEANFRRMNQNELGRTTIRFDKSRKSIMKKYTQPVMNKAPIQSTTLNTNKNTNNNTPNNTNNHINFELEKYDLNKIKELITYFNTQYIFEYKKNYEKEVKRITDKCAIIVDSNYINNIQFNDDPAKLKCKMDIAKDSYCTQFPGNVATFKTKLGQCLVAYGKENGALIFYDLNACEIIRVIHNAHSNCIYICKYYLQKFKETDLLISSSKDKCIKIWDLNDNFNNLLTIQTKYTGCKLYSANMLFETATKNSFILTAEVNDFIKVYDFDGEFIRNIGEKKQGIYFMEIYYENDDKEFVITGSSRNTVNVYNFKDGKLFNHFQSGDGAMTTGIKVCTINNTTHLITGDWNGDINVYDFHRGVLLYSFKNTGNRNDINVICIWNEHYLLAGCYNNQIKVFNIESGELIKSYQGHGENGYSYGVASIEKFIHPVYEECIITQGRDGYIKLWAVDN